MKYGRLVVVGVEGSVRLKHECVCDCGKVVFVRLCSLRSGNTKSCGCLRADAVSRRFSKHGLVWTKEYTSWQLMKDRCYNKKNKTYRYYGGKGIRVCSEWKNDFPKFLLDMGKKPSSDFSIDRIDGLKNYNNENCRWATKTEQVRNRKNTIKINYEGVERPLAEWCEILNLDYTKTYKRLWRGWDINRSFKEK